MGLLLAILALLGVLFVYVVLRSGPLAPVAVTIDTAKLQSIRPALYGLGTVQARFRYKIGPTQPGRLLSLEVHVGDMVSGGQAVGEMEHLDLDDRIYAQQAAIRGGESSLRQAEVKREFAQSQTRRYEQALESRSSSEEIVAAKRQEEAVAEEAVKAARDAIVRMSAELKALQTLRNNLRLLAPAEGGLVVARHADPGSALAAGQTVIEVIDPKSLWVDTRFDQISAEGLAPGLPARIVLRSKQALRLPGRVLRVEPQADVVTEEVLAKIIFDPAVSPMPPLGELAEVTLFLPELPSVPVIPNAAVRTVDGRRGVWTFSEGKIVFKTISLGRSDLEGRVQVARGLAEGEQVVVYGEKALTTRSRVHVVERLPGVEP